MTGLLRFVGMLNAAVWLGGTIFCSTVLLVAMHSHEAVTLIGAQYVDQVAGGLSLITFKRLFHLQLLCAVLAWAHLTAEWLYLGRFPKRFWATLLAGLFSLSLLGSIWISPKLIGLHRAQYAANLTPQARETVQRSFTRWNGVFQAINMVLIGGIGLFFWQLTNPQDEPRFVVPTKFRS